MRRSNYINLFLYARHILYLVKENYVNYDCPASIVVQNGLLQSGASVLNVRLFFLIQQKGSYLKKV